MLLIRRFEERICEVYHTDVVKSPVHLSIGQEAVAVGVCEALKPQDFVSNTYRCHATHIAKGGDLNKMMAELYGKVDGCAGGKAGSMHLVEIEKGILGASAVVATTIPVAAGWALVLKREKKNNIIVSFFGDGATEGCKHHVGGLLTIRRHPSLTIVIGVVDAPKFLIETSCESGCVCIALSVAHRRRVYGRAASDSYRRVFVVL